MVVSIFIVFPIYTYGYQLTGKKWRTPEFKYFINPIGIDDSIDYKQYSQLIIDAIGKWATVPTASIEMKYLGESSIAEWGVMDNKNMVIWKKEGWSGNVIGLSTYWYSGGNITDSDIQLNTAFANDSRLQGLVTHEVGHSIGIAHTREKGENFDAEEFHSIMFWLLHSQKELNAHDRCALTAVYPESTACVPENGTSYYSYIPCCSGVLPVLVAFSKLQNRYNGQIQLAEINVDPSEVPFTVIYKDSLGNKVEQPIDAGSYRVEVFVHEPGYEYREPFTDQFIIEKETLKVQVVDTTVVFGEPQPPFRLNYIGLINNDTPETIDSIPVAYLKADWPLLPGEYPIFVAGGNDNNYEFEYKNGILVIIPSTVNVGADFVESDFCLYPNPVLSGQPITFESGTSPNVRKGLVVVSDMLGRIVASTDLDPSGQIQIKPLAPGVYRIVFIVNGNIKEQRKLIVR
jgi:hypothetical protein